MTLQEFIKHTEARLLSLNLFESIPLNKQSSQYYIDALREVVDLINPVQEMKFVLLDEKVIRIK